MIKFILPLFICASAFSQVVTSFSILNDITQNLVPARIQVQNLVPAGQDSHGYQASVKDLLTIRKAELVLLVGQHFEPWADSLIKKSKTKAKTYYVTKNLKLIPHDPHIWQSPQTVIELVQNLSQVLIEKYPDDKSDIEKLSASYIEKLKSLQAKYKTEFAAIAQDKRKMIIAHNSFQYFAQEFSVKVDAPLDASQEGEPSVKKVSELVKKIKSENIQSLFFEKSSPEAVMKSIAKSSGKEISGTLYSDCLSEASSADTYIKMLDYNFNLILKSMKEENK